ncbi:hypothetical protein [Solwaraspora sp. WMMA2065]|nr:hypothetical protein [Solwaraspora sp. WMMA2065]WJK38032.1 hypothetical protein O7610_29315 [Solwaraspora sp. WMMA2065]
MLVEERLELNAQLLGDDLVRERLTREPGTASERTVPQWISVAPTCF